MAARIIYLATANSHKVAEFQSLAARDSLPIVIRYATREVEAASPPLPTPIMPPVPEDTGAFVGNARQKATALRSLLPPSTWVLADDSGLCVDALNGAPGVDSAIYAGRHGDAAGNRAKLLAALAGVPSPQRTAHFLCLLLLLTDTDEHVFEGRCEGRIALAERGAGGFGYDPLFEVSPGGPTMAELPESEKNRISHRGRAWAAFAAWLRAHA